MTIIYKASNLDTNRVLKVSGKVSKVYDCNGYGNLLEVAFEQTSSSKIVLINPPYGEVYYQYW